MKGIPHKSILAHKWWALSILLAISLFFTFGWIHGVMNSSAYPGNTITVSSAMLETMVGERALAEEFKNPMDLFIEKTDSYLKKDLENPWIHNTNEAVVGVSDENQPAKSLPKEGMVILLSSVTNNRLSNVGGTGHWYHLLQSVLPSIKEAHDQIWGEEARQKLLSVNKNAFEDAYIVFHESQSVENLNSFTRFCAAMVLTAGKFKRVHFGYAKEATVSSTAAKVQDLHVLFTADFEKQSLSQLFVSSSVDYKAKTAAPSGAASAASGSTTNLRHAPSVSFRHSFTVQLMSPRRQFMWFLTPSKKHLFKKAYSQLCHLPDTAPAVVDVRQYEADSSNNNNNPYRQQQQQQTVEALSVAGLSNRQRITHTNNPALLNDARSYAKAQVSITNSPEELFQLPPDDIETVANTANHELRVDRSLANPFRLGLPLSKAFASYPGPVSAFSAVNDTRNLATSAAASSTPARKVIIYQRDSSRRFMNEEEVQQVLELELEKQDKTRTSSGAYAVYGMKHIPASWDVELVKHDPQRSPCDLVHMMQSTTALFTTHGFQSTLLLFLPDESVLAEVHTSSAFFPHHFGQLQLAFRQRFGDKRSFLAEESLPTCLLGRLLEVVYGDSCEDSRFCRNLAKKQDVIASRSFLLRFANFLKTHFYA